MANWKYSIDVRDAWKKAEAREITAQEMAAIVIEKLKALPCFNTDLKLQIIVDGFETIHEDSTFDDFDVMWGDLYDWGDQEVAPYGKYPRNAKCWIGAVI